MVSTELLIIFLLLFIKYSNIFILISLLLSRLNLNGWDIHQCILFYHYF